MGHVRPGPWGLYEPQVSDLVKPVSNDLPAVLTTVESALSLSKVQASADAVSKSSAYTDGAVSTRVPFKPAAAADFYAGITDENDNQSWLGMRSDGTPTSYAATQIAANSTGVAGIKLPVTRFVCWGDSLTFGQSAAGVRYGDVMASILGISQTVRGWQANGSANIAFRAGGFTPQVTADVSVAAGTTVTVPLSVQDGWRVGGSFNIDMPCTVQADNGSATDGATIVTLTGTLRQVVGATTVGTFQFIRAADSFGTVTIKSGTPLVGSDGDGLNDQALVICVGRNDIDTPNAMLRDINSILAHNNRTPRRYIILTTTSSRSAGAADLAKVTTATATIAAAHGAHVLDTQAWLSSTDAFTAVGLTPTTDDTTAMASGLIGPSLTNADGVHWNNYGQRAVGIAAANLATTLGWKAP